jgi:hypothetical protein
VMASWWKARTDPRDLVFALLPPPDDVFDIAAFPAPLPLLAVGMVLDRERGAPDGVFAFDVEVVVVVFAFAFPALAPALPLPRDGGSGIHSSEFSSLEDMVK